MTHHIVKSDLFNILKNNLFFLSRSEEPGCLVKPYTFLMHTNKISCLFQIFEKLKESILIADLLSLITPA